MNSPRQSSSSPIALMTAVPTMVTVHASAQVPDSADACRVDEHLGVVEAHQVDAPCPPVLPGRSWLAFTPDVLAKWLNVPAGNTASGRPVPPLLR
jgi:hypothetical protein